MVRTPATPGGRRSAAALLLAVCLAASSRDGRHWTWGGVWTRPGGTRPRIGLISHGGVGAVAEFDYVRIYQP